VSTLRFGLAASRVARHLDMADGLVDSCFEITEIDRLGSRSQTRRGHRGTDVAHVAIGRNNDGRSFCLRRPAASAAMTVRHPGIFMSDPPCRHLDDPRSTAALDPVVSEYDITPPSRFACGISAASGLEIGLIVDDEDGRGHAACPSLVSISAAPQRESIGWSRGQTAPRSIALRRVSHRP